MTEDNFNISKANEEQATVAKGAVLPDGTYQSLETKDVVVDKAATEISETQKKAQTDYLAALGIRPDGRRTSDPRWVLESIQKGVPHWRFDWNEHEKNQKYPPAELRRLRAERGVGKRKRK